MTGPRGAMRLANCPLFELALLFSGNFAKHIDGSDNFF